MKPCLVYWTNLQWSVYFCVLYKITVDPVNRLGFIKIYKQEPSVILLHVEDLERTQKSFTKMILNEKYKTYDNALLMLNLDSLQIRRTALTLKFAKTGIKHKKLDDLFPENKKQHKMETRNTDKFQTIFANTSRLQNSSIPTMQACLNADERLTKKRKWG